jgi:peptidoglycan/LPS O-acetylase OafA/YrhL
MSIVLPANTNAIDAKTEARKDTSRVQLDYLDGLRGIAAVYVVLGHIYIALKFFSPDVTPPNILMTLLSVFNIGQTAVDIFIVLSGYCLMLPVIRSNGIVRGGLFYYLRRRATRILPPYYAALVISLLLIALMNTTGLRDQSQYNDFQLDVLLTHLFVVHNWSELSIHAIDPPMWSVATEWQIYFLFPLFLLPIWRRFGTLTSVVAGFALGFAPRFLLNGYLNSSFPWFIGLFALGMAAANINFSEVPNIVMLRQRVPWGRLALAIWVSIISFLAINRGWYSTHQWIADPIIGAATMCLLIYCTQFLTTDQTGRAPLALRLMTSGWAVAFGTFSYSIYLIHYPVMVLFWNVMMQIQMSSLARAGLMLTVCFPLTLALSYVFHLAFERHFMPGHLHQKRASAG